MPFDHSFLSGGSDFSVFFKSFFYHFASSYQSILLGGVDVACQFFFFHAALLCYSMLLGKTTLPLFTPLGGAWFYLFIYIYFFQESLLSSLMFLPFQTSEKCHWITQSFLEGLISVYFSINSSINLHCSINPCFWKGVDVACHFFYRIGGWMLHHPALLCHCGIS